MANGARFRITGSVSGAHPSSTPGATVTAGETLTLQLEDTSSNILNAKYEIVEDSAAAAPALTLNPADGVPTPSATSAVTLVVPLTGPWSYKIRCTANRRYDANGTLIYDWMFERIIAIEPQGLRHILPSEVGEFDPVYTWVQACNAMVTASQGGPIPFEESTGVFRPETYGAVGDIQTVTDGVTGAGDATVTSATAGFASTDVGKVIRIRGAGAAGADLQTTIASVTNGTTIELTVAATTAVNPATIDWGTDDGAALQDWLTATANAGGGRAQLRSKRYATTRNLGLTGATGVTVCGNGLGASSIEDLRADDAIGLPTGTYRATLSFISCDGCGVTDMSVAGCINTGDIGEPYASTVNIGRMGIWSHNCDDFRVERVGASLYHDEAIVTSGNCPGWDCIGCVCRNNLGNCINPGMAATDGAGVRIIGNACLDNGGTGIMVAGAAATITGNVIDNSGLAGTQLGFDLVVLDISSRIVFVGNTISNSSATSQGVSPIHLFGTPNVNASCIIANNVLSGLDGYWRKGIGGAIIRCEDVAGSLVITGNSLVGCEPSTVWDHVGIWIEDAAATSFVTIDGNTARNPAGGNLLTAIYVSGSTVGASVRVGDNHLSGFTTEYDVDSSVQFTGSCYVTSVEIGIGDTPYTVPVGVSRVNVDLSGGAIQCNLPPIAKMLGREIQFLDVTGSCSAVNTLTIEGDGAETVNGAANVVGTTARQPITVYARSGGWVTTAPVF